MDIRGLLLDELGDIFQEWHVQEVEEMTQNGTPELKAVESVANRAKKINKISKNRSKYIEAIDEINDPKPMLDEHNAMIGKCTNNVLTAMRKLYEASDSALTALERNPMLHSSKVQSQLSFIDKDHLNELESSTKSTELAIVHSSIHVAVLHLDNVYHSLKLARNKAQGLLQFSVEQQMKYIHATNSLLKSTIDSKDMNDIIDNIQLATRMLLETR